MSVWGIVREKLLESAGRQAAHTRHPALFWQETGIGGVCSFWRLFVVGLAAGRMPFQGFQSYEY